MFFLRRSAAIARNAPVAQVARAYASAAKSSPVPLQLHGIEGRYATALYSAAQKKNALQNVESDLNNIRSILEREQELKTALESPLVNKNQKKQLLHKITGKGVTDITRNFFDALAENGRLNQTTKVLNAFQQLMAAYRHEVPVTVISAKELDNRTSKQLQNILQKSNLVEQGSKLIVNNKVDPAILGGLIVDFGDKTIDLSVASKINKLNRLLTEAI